MGKQTTSGLEKKLISKYIKVIAGDEAGEYLERLNAKLSDLSKVFQKEETQSISHFIEVIRDSIGLLALKHQLTSDVKIDFDLTISSKDSGFPTERDFYSLEKNREEAKAVLDSLPSRDDIIERIRRAILSGVPVENFQNMLRRYNFFTVVKDRDVLFGRYHLDKPKFLKSEERRRFYTLNWSFIDRFTRTPIFYRMCINQDEGSIPLEEQMNPALETLIYTSCMQPLNLGAFARRIDNEVKEVHPKLIERCAIGPFYNSITENSEEINALLAESDNTSILKFSITRVLSERVTRFGNFFDYLLGRKTEREVFSPVFTESGMIVPFRLRQEIGNKDEYGKPCKIYGITIGGDVIG